MMLGAQGANDARPESNEISVPIKKKEVKC